MFSARGERAAAAVLVYTAEAAEEAVQSDAKEIANRDRASFTLTTGFDRRDNNITTTGRRTKKRRTRPRIGPRVLKTTTTKDISVLNSFRLSHALSLGRGLSCRRRRITRPTTTSSSSTKKKKKSLALIFLHTLTIHEEWDEVSPPPPRRSVTVPIYRNLRGGSRPALRRQRQSELVHRRRLLLRTPPPTTFHQSNQKTL